MKYAIQNCISFTELEAVTRKSTADQLNALMKVEYPTDDCYVTNDEIGVLTATLRFDEGDKTTADDLYNSLAALLSPSGKGFLTFVEIHECYHDEQPPRPCRLIKRNQL